ncbi:MAG: hypothetical protein ACREGE_00670 [Candidatus Microsaccharimonas sp.]
MNNNSYEQFIVKFNPADVPDLYSDWDWLIDKKYLNEPWLMTCFGDLFFKTPDASIHFLDTLEGVIIPFAENEESAKKLLADATNQSRFLSSDAVTVLRERNLILRDNELYIYVPHPIIAKAIVLDSVQIMSMNVVLSLGGQLLRQVQ